MQQVEVIYNFNLVIMTVFPSFNMFTKDKSVLVFLSLLVPAVRKKHRTVSISKLIISFPFPLLRLVSYILQTMFLYLITQYTDFTYVYLYHHIRSLSNIPLTLQHCVSLINHGARCRLNTII